MVEITINIDKVLENIQATGDPLPSVNDCKARLEVLGFEQLGDIWRCPVSRLQALDDSEYRINY